MPAASVKMMVEVNAGRRASARQACRKAVITYSTEPADGWVAEVERGVRRGLAEQPGGERIVAPAVHLVIRAADLPHRAVGIGRDEMGGALTAHEIHRHPPRQAVPRHLERH